ncbi:MAG TPA: hypothetical protein VML57_10195 [Burkholderiales bacterium]|jgi:hypothetical protein|nr:hypothetical protein [Burkholderiales bacterium]
MNPGPKLCPSCGSPLEAQYDQAGFPAGRFVAMEVLYWLALAMILGLLWSSGGARQLQAVLGIAVLAAWFLLRSRHRRAAREALVRKAGRYRCENCQRRFKGEELREEEEAK